MKEIMRLIKESRVILFGEIHGTREIPELMKEILFRSASCHEINLGLEIPSTYQTEVNLFLTSGKESLLKKIPFFKSHEKSDGRNSREYSGLIKFIYGFNKRFSKKIKIFCLDVSEKGRVMSQNERERKIKYNILKKIYPNKKLAVVLGNFHVSKKIFCHKKIRIFPVAYRLHKKLGESLVTINLHPLSGKFYNFGIKEIKSPKNEGSFDYVYNIKKVHPCSFLENKL